MEKISKKQLWFVFSYKNNLIFSSRRAIKRQFHVCTEVLCEIFVQWKFHISELWMKEWNQRLL